MRGHALPMLALAGIAETLMVSLGSIARVTIMGLLRGSHTWSGTMFLLYYMLAAAIAP